MYTGNIQTAGAGHVYLPVTVLPQGNTTPLLGEGDPSGVLYSVSRTAAGNYLLTTKNSYFACVYLSMESSTGMRVRWGEPVQNADKTWSVGIYCAGDSGSVALGAGTVTAGGSGYTSAPTITYNNAHGNVGLKGTVTVVAGAVTAVTITEGGFGSDGTAPTITLTGGGGTAATATVALGTNSAADPPVGSQIRVNAIWRNSQVTP